MRQAIDTEKFEIHIFKKLYKFVYYKLPAIQLEITTFTKCFFLPNANDVWLAALTTFDRILLAHTLAYYMALQLPLLFWVYFFG